MTNTISWRTVAAATIAAILTMLLLPAVPTQALTSTSILPSDPRPGETAVDYTFDSSGFTTATSVQCIDLVLNDQSDGAGTAVGTTTGFTVGSSTVITPGSWTVDDTVNGRLRLTNGAGEAPLLAAGNIVYSGLTNGALEATTYYAIFTSYTDAACTPGNEVDQSTLAYVLKAGELVELTIDPTLTFTCSPVAIGQTVNGATTTAASTATGIDHDNNVTAVANGISAHDLNISTNAPSGYTVSIRHTGQLTNGAGDMIADFTAGTNAAPATFTAAGTEGWGYTTEDITLAGGTANRFATNNWAGFTTTNDPVVDNATFTTGTDTVRVGHQVGVSNTTPAGTYQTTVIYTVSAVF